MKVRDRITRLQRTAPNVSKFGQLYRLKRDTRSRYRRVTLHTWFVSEENTNLIRPHVFQSDDARNGAEWSRWFGQLVNETNGRQDEPRTIQRLTYIHKTAVLPGIALRTGKAWAVKRIIGWIGHAKYRARNSRVARRRNKAHKKGRKSGQIRIRRR